MSFKRPAVLRRHTELVLLVISEEWDCFVIQLSFYTFLCCLKYFQCTATTLNKNFVLSMLYLRYNYGCYMFLPHKQVYYRKRKPSCTGKSIHYPSIPHVHNRNPSTALALYGQNFVIFQRHQPPFECFSVPATLP